MTRTLLILALGFSACGEPADDDFTYWSEDRSSSGWRDYYSPWQDTPKPAAEEATDEVASESEEQGMCLAGVCQPPPDLLLSFTQPASIAPDGCVASQLSLLDKGTGFMAFVKANCDGTEGVYAVPVSYTGVRGTPLRLTEACATERVGLHSLQVAGGPGHFMMALVCRDWNNVYRTYAAALDQGGVPRAFQLLATQTTTSPPSSALVAWNELAGFYGVAWNGSFQRLDSLGVKWGGTTYVPVQSGFAFSQLEAFAGSWSLRQSPTSSFSYSEPTCSKITAASAVQCDRKGIDLPYAYVTSRVVSEKWWLALSSSGDAHLSPFDPATCETDTARKMGRLADTQISAVFDAKATTKNYLAMLYKAQNPALQLAFFDIAAGGHLTTIPLFDAGLVSHGQVIEKQGRFYVSAVKDGDAVLTVGDRLP